MQGKVDTSGLQEIVRVANGFNHLLYFFAGFAAATVTGLMFYHLIKAAYRREKAFPIVKTFFGYQMAICFGVIGISIAVMVFQALVDPGVSLVNSITTQIAGAFSQGTR